MMEYREPKAISRGEAEEAFESGDAARINDALVGVAFHDADWRWVQDACLRLLGHPDDEVRGLAATCLGHVARIHRQLDLDRVAPTLDALRHDPVIGGRVDEALDDIEIYVENG